MAVLYGQGFVDFEAFLQDEHDPVQREIFLAAYDADGRVGGWACCRRFHERHGYARAFRYFTDFTQAEFADRLFAACTAQARQMGADTLVGLVRSDMERLLVWHRGSGFSKAGSIMLPNGLQLTVFLHQIPA